MEPLINTCSVGAPGGKLKYMKNSRFDDLKKIHLLKTLSTQGNLNKTAQIHKITASAVSQSIKTLEVNLGYPVIVKAHDTWKLTEKGNQLLEQTEKIFAALDETFSTDQTEDLHLSSLALGAYESLALELIQGFSKKIRNDYPDIKLNFQISRSSDLIKKIQSGELCSAIVAETDDLPDSFKKHTIFSDTLGVYASPQLGFKNINEIKNCLVGIISGGGDGQPNYLKKFLKQLPNLKPNLVCDSLEVLRNIAEKGEAVVVLPKRIAQNAHTPLLEIVSSESFSAGQHDIFLIASGTCDQREFEYLISILKK